VTLSLLLLRRGEGEEKKGGEEFALSSGVKKGHFYNNYTGEGGGGKGKGSHQWISSVVKRLVGSLPAGGRRGGGQHFFFLRPRGKERKRGGLLCFHPRLGKKVAAVSNLSEKGRPSVSFSFESGEEEARSSSAGHRTLSLTPTKEREKARPLSRFVSIGTEKKKEGGKRPGFFEYPGQKLRSLLLPWRKKPRLSFTGKGKKKKGGKNRSPTSDT